MEQELDNVLSLEPLPARKAIRDLDLLASAQMENAYLNIYYVFTARDDAIPVCTVAINLR